MPWAGAAAVVGALGCAWWASHGLSLGWVQNGDRANDWMVFFLTAMEPIIFLLAEHVRERRVAMRAAQAAPTVRQTTEQPRVTPLRRAQVAVGMAALGAASLGAGNAAAAAHEPVAGAAIERVVATHVVRAAARRADAEHVAQQKDKARALLAARELSHRAIAARVGLSPRTVDRIALGQA